jgi:hypothetical protein
VWGGGGQRQAGKHRQASYPRVEGRVGGPGRARGLRGSGGGLRGVRGGGQGGSEGGDRGSERALYCII